jgi:hypothetical protein
MYAQRHGLRLLLPSLLEPHPQIIVLDAGGRNLNDVKMTDGGRTVYGGGITPDEKYETP